MLSRKQTWKAVVVTVLVVVSLMAGAVMAADKERGPAGSELPITVGVAMVDVTPDGPIRLNGYAVRKTESTGVAQRLWAKALAIGNDSEGPAVLITVDNCMVPREVTEEVARRLAEKAGIKRERFVVCASHTHAGPCLTGAAPFIFGEPTPPEHQKRIDQYTDSFTSKLEKVALNALAARQPGHLAWAQGQAGFAGNRRRLTEWPMGRFRSEPRRARRSRPAPAPCDRSRGKTLGGTGQLRLSRHIRQVLQGTW